MIVLIFHIILFKDDWCSYLARELLSLTLIGYDFRQMLLFSFFFYFAFLASCSDPGTPLHGETIGSAFEHDSVVNFQCLSNRVLDGAPRMKCNNGQWDAQRPTCRGLKVVLSN